MRSRATLLWVPAAFVLSSTMVVRGAWGQSDAARGYGAAGTLEISGAGTTSVSQASSSQGSETTSTAVSLDVALGYFVADGLAMSAGFGVNQSQVATEGLKTRTGVVLGFGFNPLYVFATPVDSKDAAAARAFIQPHLGYWMLGDDGARLNGPSLGASVGLRLVSAWAVGFDTRVSYVHRFYRGRADTSVAEDQLLFGFGIFMWRNTKGWP